MKSVLHDKIFSNRTILQALVASALLISCGCGFNQPPPTVQYYTLDYAAPDPIGAPPLPVSIVVKPFQAQSPYDTRRIVYAENAYKRSTYTYHQWMTDPATMLTNLLVRDLRAADFAQTLITLTPGAEADYVLEGTIEAFYENDATSNWQAVLDLSLTLMRTGKTSSPGAGSTLLQKEYRQVEPMARNNPVSLAQAMSKAMRTVSARFMKDAYPRMASDNEKPRRGGTYQPGVAPREDDKESEAP